uniref:Uncharacterized protein n=1 Tax=Rhizophora mucronata TaxID=61149 RepID=A0A2P2PL99_RHIMU
MKISPRNEGHGPHATVLESPIHRHGHRCFSGWIRCLNSWSQNNLYSCGSTLHRKSLHPTAM